MKDSMNNKSLIRETGDLKDLVFAVLPVALYEALSHTPKIRRKKMAVKTTAVVLKDGREGRGVKVSAKNLPDVAGWVKDTKSETLIVDPWRDDPRIKLHTSKGLRVARIGDTVVKLEKGVYIVIKADDFATLVKI